jgi:hypothetical protein
MSISSRPKFDSAVPSATDDIPSVSTGTPRQKFISTSRKFVPFSTRLKFQNRNEMRYLASSTLSLSKWTSHAPIFNLWLRYISRFAPSLAKALTSWSPSAALSIQLPLSWARQKKLRTVCVRFRLRQSSLNFLSNNWRRLRQMARDSTMRTYPSSKVKAQAGALRITLPT